MVVSLSAPACPLMPAPQYSFQVILSYSVGLSAFLARRASLAMAGVLANWKEH